jgi:hypothetical protein
VNDGVKYGVSAADQQKYSFLKRRFFSFCGAQQVLKSAERKTKSQQKNAVVK